MIRYQYDQMKYFFQPDSCTILYDEHLDWRDQGIIRLILNSSNHDQLRKQMKNIKEESHPGIIE